MALHQKISFPSVGSIEFHVASAPGEIFIGQNASDPASAPNIPANSATPASAKPVNITTVGAKIVNPA